MLNDRAMPQSPACRRPGCVAFTTAILLALLPVLISSPAMAQEAATAENDPWAGVEEMVVTSSGVIDALTSATVSVTAFDSSDLEAMGAADMSDVAAFTPNLEIRTAGSTSATFFIRGVGLNAFDSNASGSVAIYEDDVAKNLPAIQLKQLFDVEAVSILKGPQGSGAGRNASAGAIKVYTRKPTGEFGGFLRFDYGNFNSIDVEGAVEAPIVPDVLAARAAFSLKRRDGLVTNRCAGLTQTQIDTISGLCGNTFAADLRPGLEKDLNDIDVWAGRFTTVFEPPDVDMQWTFSFHGSRRDQLGTVGEHIGAQSTFGGQDRLGYVQPEIGDELRRILEPLPTPSNGECRRQFRGDPAGEAACRATAAQSRALASSILAENLATRPLDLLPFEGAYNNPGYERQTSWGAYAKGEWTLDAVKIDSITGFERDDRERLIDADYSPNTAFEFLIEDDLWQFTQDVQVSGELEETPLSWSTGVFYLEERLDYYQFTFTRTPFEPSVADYIQDTRSFGIFGDIEWNILTDVTLEAGARYNWEYKRFDAQIFADPGGGLASQCRISDTGDVPPCQRTLTVDHPTGTIKLNYDIDELRNVYVQYAHGWKGAQFNARDARKAGAVTDVADPEVIDAFEIGFKGSWFDERLRLTSAFFWYAYDNYQVFTFSNNAGEPPQRIVINADDAELYGAEVETTLEPFDGLIAELRFSWLESRFLDFTDAVGRQDGTNAGRLLRIVSDFNNNPLPNAPRFKISGNVSYPFPLVGGMTLTPRYEFSWSDDVFFDPSGGRGAPDATGEIFMPDYAIGQEALILHNLRVTLTNESGSIELSGWVRNLTNEVYKQLAFDASAGPALVGNLIGDPRTYGLSAKVSF